MWASQLLSARRWTNRSSIASSTCSLRITQQVSTLDTGRRTGAWERGGSTVLEIAMKWLLNLFTRLLFGANQEVIWLRFESLHHSSFSLKMFSTCCGHELPKPLLVRVFDWATSTRHGSVRPHDGHPPYPCGRDRVKHSLTASNQAFSFSSPLLERSVDILHVPPSNA